MGGGGHEGVVCRAKLSVSSGKKQPCDLKKI